MPADMRVMENVIFGTSVICGLIIIGNIFCNIYLSWRRSFRQKCLCRNTVFVPFHLRGGRV